MGHLNTWWKRTKFKSKDIIRAKFAAHKPGMIHWKCASAGSKPRGCKVQMLFLLLKQYSSVKTLGQMPDRHYMSWLSEMIHKVLSSCKNVLFSLILSAWGTHQAAILPAMSTSMIQEASSLFVFSLLFLWPLPKDSAAPQSLCLSTWCSPAPAPKPPPSHSHSRLGDLSNHSN